MGAFLVPQAHYTYAHPGDARPGAPMPSTAFGTVNFGNEGTQTLGAVLPPTSWLLGRIAPTTPYELAIFEWRLTSFYLFFSMLGAFGLARQSRVAPLPAAAAAILWPFTWTVFGAWSDFPVTRGRLLVPAMLWAIGRAIDRRSWSSWLLAATASVLCLGQSYIMAWAVPATALYLLTIAWVRRRELRAGLPGWLRSAAVLPALAALGVAAGLLGPPYLRGAEAWNQSAFLSLLSHSPPDLLHYLKSGSRWFTLHSSLLPPEGFGPLFLGGALALPLLARRTRAALPELALPGVTLLVVGLALGFANHLPIDDILVADGTDVRLGPTALRVPAAVAVTLHAAGRTWMPMAELGLLLLTFAALRLWQTPGQGLSGRITVAAGAFLLWVLAVAATGLASGFTTPTTYVLAGTAIAVPLGCLAAMGAPSFGVRRAATVLLVGAAVAIAAFELRTLLDTGSRRCAVPESNPDLVLATHRSMLATMPDQVRGDRRSRLVVSAHTLDYFALCYYLDTGCGLTYPIRLLPPETLRFFIESGAVRDIRFPYFISLDYDRLHGLGLTELLGARHWVTLAPAGTPITPAFLADGGRPLVPEGFPLDVRYHQLPAFDRGWLVSEWQVADDYSQALRQVIELGREGRLDEVAVIAGPRSPAPDDGPASPGAASVEVEVPAAGELRFATRSPRPEILATNEFWHEAWSATVDGAPAPILRVNAGFLGVTLDAGSHQVVLRYRR